MRRILQAGQLHQDAVRIDPLDGRLGDADLVDALAHDLQALLDRAVEAVAQAGFVVVQELFLSETARRADVVFVLAVELVRTKGLGVKVMGRKDAATEGKTPHPGRNPWGLLALLAWIRTQPLRSPRVYNQALVPAPGSKPQATSRQAGKK